MGVSLELAPLSRTHVPILRRLALLGSFSTSLGLSSSIPGGGSVATTFRRWRAGARLSAPLGERSHVGAEVTYGAWSFLFDSDRDDLPDASYRVLRGGLDLRLDSGSVALLLGAGFGPLRGAGPMEDRFPRLSGGALDARLGVAIPVHSRLEARVWSDYTRNFLTLNPEPGDRFIAGGALDQSVTVHLDAALSL